MLTRWGVVGSFEKVAGRGVNDDRAIGEILCRKGLVSVSISKGVIEARTSW